jgi:hypothetical protein
MRKLGGVSNKELDFRFFRQINTYDLRANLILGYYFKVIAHSFRLSWDVEVLPWSDSLPVVFN